MMKQNVGSPRSKNARSRKSDLHLKTIAHDLIVI
jgi:hypothetical protein